MSRKVLLNLDYALIQGMYWAFYVVAGLFVSVYMLGKGYSNTCLLYTSKEEEDIT